MQKHAFLVAAPRSNSGKTLVTLGLIRALINRGYRVQPYKCGPDYIDPMHHRQVSGMPSYNLDTWMASGEHVQEIFKRQMKTVDIGVVEGVMGLFDGARKDAGSPAAIARLLGLPVVLVVDASSMAYSAAPLLYGFKHFDPRIRLAGVVFNKVGSPDHARFLIEAAGDAGVGVLGYVPRDPRLAIGSRHLGLHLPGESDDAAVVETASVLIEKQINLDQLLRQCAVDLLPGEEKIVVPAKKITTAMAFDEAFCFTYQENMDVLQSLGEVKFFSPLKDKILPRADWVWLPGGYPELFAAELSGNKAMSGSIRAFVEAGKPLVAECGGMMYLGKEMIDKDGVSHEMTGIFNFATTFENSRLHMGYRQIEMKDLSLKGHEFHYSSLLNAAENRCPVNVKTARGEQAEMLVFRYKNCRASYMHLYLGEREKMLSLMNFLNIGK